MEQRHARQNSGFRRSRLAFDVGRLEDYLRRHVDGFTGNLRVEQFEGGQSNPTYKLTAGTSRYVLRRKPPGKLLPSAHAVDREYRVITALARAGFPVARSRVLCTDESVIGTAFYVMDFIDGRVFWDQSLPGMSRRRPSRDLRRDEPRHRGRSIKSITRPSGWRTTAGRAIISRARSAAGPGSTAPPRRKRSRRWTT